MTPAGRPARLFAALLAAGLLVPVPSAGQQQDCTVLCAPELKFEPTVTVENLFTGRTAEELGEEEIVDNPVELEAEVNLALLTPEETGGWLDAHVDVIDKLSPAARPDDARLFTHKLNFELDAAFLVFSRQPVVLLGAPRGARGAPRSVKLPVPGCLDDFVVVPLLVRTALHRGRDHVLETARAAGAQQPLDARSGGHGREP